MASFKKKQSKADEKLVEFVIKKLLSNAKKYDRPYRQNREDNRKFYKGDQWRKRQPSYKSKSVSNFLSLIIRDEVAILTDNPPIISVRPVDQTADPTVADVLTKIIRHIMYQNDFTTLIHKVCKSAGIEGLAYFRPNWNPLLMNKQGDIEILMEKADSVYMDPSGEKNYFIIEKDITLSEIYRHFPDKADQVKASITKDDKITSTTKKSPAMPVKSTDDSRTVMYEETDIEVSRQFDRVRFHIAWLKDETVEHIVEKKEGEKDKDIFNAKYPYGRWVFIANEKIKLEDRKCNVKHCPIVPVILDVDPETEINGISNIDYCKQMQVNYNEMHALIQDYLEGVTFPQYAYDPNSGFDPTKYRNTPGAAAPIDPGKLNWLSPAPLGNDVFKFIMEEKTNMEYITAMNDITQGRRPASITSAEGIRLLQEASKTMIRPKSRLLETAIKQVGLLILDLIQYGYSGKRIIRLLGEDVVINKPQVVEGVKKILNDVSVGQYDIYIEPDSTLPISRIERFGLMKELASDGMADRNHVIDECGLENKNEIKEAMNAKEKQANEQAAQQAQAQQQAEEAKGQRELEKIASKERIEMAQLQQDRELKERELDLKEEELALKKEEIALQAAIEAQKPTEKKEK
jgi:hypothetical protein